MSIRLILADDHKIMRDGLRALLKMQPHLEVAAATENGRVTVERLVAAAPALNPFISRSHSAPLDKRLFRNAKVQFLGKFPTGTLGSGVARVGRGAE
jgi:hypothetical protein